MMDRSEHDEIRRPTHGDPATCPLEQERPGGVASRHRQRLVRPGESRVDERAALAKHREVGIGPAAVGADRHADAGRAKRRHGRQHARQGPRRPRADDDREPVAVPGQPGEGRFVVGQVGPMNDDPARCPGQPRDPVGRGEQPRRGIPRPGAEVVEQRAKIAARVREQSCLGPALGDVHRHRQPAPGDLPGHSGRERCGDRVGGMGGDAGGEAPGDEPVEVCGKIAAARPPVRRQPERLAKHP